MHLLHSAMQPYYPNTGGEKDVRLLVGTDRSLALAWSHVISAPAGGKGAGSSYAVPRQTNTNMFPEV